MFDSRFPLLCALLFLEAAVLHPSVSTAQTPRQAILARPSAIMQDATINSDNNISTMTSKELVAWTRKVNKAAFDKLDTDKDGVISRAEYLAPDEAKLRDRMAEEVPAVDDMDENAKLEDVPFAMDAQHFKDYYATTDKEYVEQLSKTWKDRIPQLAPLSVRQTLLQDVKEVNSPARFSYNRDNVLSENYYTLDGAISYELALLKERLTLSPTVEAHISNQSTNERDSVTYALPLTWFSRLNMDENAWIKRHYLKGVGSFNTDRQQDTETLDASLLYTVDIPKLGMGATLGKDDYPIFIMRPWIGLDFGDVNKTGGVPDLAAESSFVRLRADLEATLWLSDNFSFNGRYVHHTFLNGLERSYNYGEISAVLYLDPAQVFSVGASYRRGQLAPQYKNVDNASLWMGIKF